MSPCRQIQLSLRAFAEQRYHSSSEYLLLVARCARASLNPKEAVPYFERVLEIDEGSVWAHLELGALHESLGHLKQAKHHFIAAVRYGPDSSEAHYRLGCLFAKEGKKKEAFEEYRILKTLDPDRAVRLFEIIYPDQPSKQKR